MNKKISISLAITIAIIAMTVTFSVTMVLAGQRFNNTVSSVKEKENMYSKLAEIDKYVRDNAYYEINDDTLNDTIASGYMLGTGDRAAVYYTANAYAELQDIADGKLMGIGVDVVKDASGAARIIRVYEDSPAAEAGLEKGGYITAIDGTDVKGLTRDNVTSRLRGETGTTVTVTYLNPASEEQEITLTRSRYTIPSVEYQLLADNSGYVKISAFNNNTASQLDYAIHQLTSSGATGLIFDVRNTSGGSLETQKSKDTAAYTSGSGQSGIQVDLPSASEDTAQENGASVTVGPSNQADLPTVHVSVADIGDLLDGREPAETENSGTLRYLLTRQEYDDLVAELADRGVSLEEPDADSQQLWLEVTAE